MPSFFPTTEASVADKLERYLLNPDHEIGRAKALWFERALGFTRANSSELAEQIRFDPAKAVPTQSTPHGQKFEQVIPVVGANGRTIDVKFLWIRQNNGIVHLVTAIPIKRPRGSNA